MKITVNSKEVETTSQTVAELAKELDFPEKGIALAINNGLVPRTDWEGKSLTEGDKIIIIKATCGG